DLLDDAGAFVSEHARRVARGVRTRSRVQVGMADPARREPDERLAGLRLLELDLLHGERLTELLQHGGPNLHARDRTPELPACRPADLRPPRTPTAPPVLCRGTFSGPGRERGQPPLPGGGPGGLGRGETPGAGMAGPAAAGRAPRFVVTSRYLAAGRTALWSG